MKLYTISENDADQRLDRFLKKLLPNAAKTLIFKINRKEKIKVLSVQPEISKNTPHPQPLSLGGEGSKVIWKFRKKDNEYKIQIGDQIKIFLTDSEFEELQKVEIKTEILAWVALDKKDIAYEDAHLLVLNKNPGMNVHPGDHKTKESNVIAQVQDYLWASYNSLTFKPSLIHRIDRDTSGILMIAKQKQILTQLVNDFKSHTKVKKTYYAIVLWKLSRSWWTIKKNLLRIENAKNESKIQVNEAGQTAVSHYKKIAEHTINIWGKNIDLTEVEVQIETGRMHQIRVHMAHIWNPIICDKAYGNKQINALIQRQYGLRRQALHAWKIDFFHYGRNKQMGLTAKLKADIQEFLNKI